MQVPNLQNEKQKLLVTRIFISLGLALHALGIIACINSIWNNPDINIKILSGIGIIFILNGGSVLFKIGCNRKPKFCIPTRLLCGYRGRVWSLIHVRDLMQYLTFRFTPDDYLRRAVFATACLKGPKHPTEVVLKQGFYLLNKSITQMQTVRSELSYLLLYGTHATPGWEGYCHIHILLGRLTKVRATIRRFQSLKIDWNTLDHGLTVTPELLQHYFTVVDELTAYATYVYLRSATYVRVLNHV